MVYHVFVVQQAMVYNTLSDTEHKRMNPLIYQELTFDTVLVKIIFQRLALSYVAVYENRYEL